MRIGPSLGLNRARRAAGGNTPTPPPVYDPAAQTYFDAMTVQPSAARKQLLSDMFAGLRTDGLLSKFDVLQLYAGHDRQAAMLNIVDPSTYAMAPVELGTDPVLFTPDRGFTTNGVDNYLDTMWAPATAAKYQQNDASWGVYNNGAETSSDISIAGTLVGTGSTADGLTLQPNNGGVVNARINSRAAVAVNIGTSTALGTIAAARLGTSVTLYRSGDLVSTTTSTSYPRVAGTMWIGRLNGGVFAYRPGRFAYFFAGSHLTAADMANLRTRLVGYLTAIGANA